MAVGAIVKDGAIMETASQQSVGESKAPNGYDKDAFLQLLVAQMKYQDPMEPTSNTEYISQYATFSQVEQLQNMAGAMELTRASSLVGETVQISTTLSNGETKNIEGDVDYVKYENGKAYVSVAGDLYAASDVTAVIDKAYNTAFELAEAFAKAINSLPTLGNLSISDSETIEGLREGYAALTSYQQSFIDKSYVETLQEYVKRMAEINEEYKNYIESQKENAKEAEDSTEEQGSEVSEEAIDALLADTE